MHQELHGVDQQQVRNMLVCAWSPGYIQHKACLTRAIFSRISCQMQLCSMLCLMRTAINMGGKGRGARGQEMPWPNKVPGSVELVNSLTMQ